MSTLYEEAKANLTWYKLNSNFQDPMYQYMYKLEQELYSKYISKPTNFNTVDGVIVDQTKILQYGTYQCSAPGKEAYMDSWFSCLLFQLPFFLESIQLGYIGFVFVLPIIIISIFGGIKESYKWFILNQAIWDAFVCYDFICAKPSLIGWFPGISNLKTTCFYYQYSNVSLKTYVHPVIEILTTGFRQFLRNAPFIPIFLLAFSRFLAMYFSNFYKNFTKNGYKIAIFILIFYICCILLFSIPKALVDIAFNLRSIDFKNCENTFCPGGNYTYCYENNQKYFQCYNEIVINNNLNEKLSFLKIPLNFIQHLIPPISFLLSIIFVAALFYKIAAQLKFQKATNQSAFNQTIKISSVVGFQCLIMSLIFVVIGIQKYLQIKGNIVGSYTVYTELPPWLFLLQYYTTTTSLNMIRVFFDSILVLSILSGYSKYMKAGFKFIFLCFYNPKMAVKKIKYSISKGRKNTVTTIAPISGKS